MIRLSFYDFRIFSTLGFSEDSIKNFKNIKGVKHAEGTKSVDALMDFSGDTDAYIIYSVPSDVNLLSYHDGDSSSDADDDLTNDNAKSLVSGRLPENKDECLADAKEFSDSDIGKKISLSDENSDTVSDSLSEKEFTITGLVDSPLYIGNDRGTVSIRSCCRRCRKSG